MTIYLDHNATTPLLPEVVDAMLPYLRDHFGNPSSSHVFGACARDAVEAARAQVSALLACESDEVFFTSGGTEANNLAIRGVAEAAGDGHVITSKIEHPATSAPCRHLGDHGWRVDTVDVDAFGRVRVDRLRERLSKDTKLVTIMHANNETGTMQPISEIGAMVREQGALFHTDAAQSVGKVPTRVDELHVDLLTVAGHKLNAPKGVGALYVRRGTAIKPFALGAGHERGLRPGTENVASIVGLGVACELARVRMTEKMRAWTALRERLWSGLSNAIPGVALNGHPEERLPNTLNVRFPRVGGTALLAATPEIAASTGSACHEGGETASAVLLAMGVPPKEALGSVRLSLGTTTTEVAIDEAVLALVRAWRSLAEQA